MCDLFFKKRRQKSIKQCKKIDKTLAFNLFYLYVCEFEQGFVLGQMDITVKCNTKVVRN